MTADGTKFESKADALRHELTILVRPILDNDALAQKFVSGLTSERIAEMRQLLSEMMDDANG